MPLKISIQEPRPLVLIWNRQGIWYARFKINPSPWRWLELSHVVYHDNSSRFTVPRVAPTILSWLGTLTLSIHRCHSLPVELSRLQYVIMITGSKPWPYPAYHTNACLKHVSEDNTIQTTYSYNQACIGKFIAFNQTLWSFHKNFSFEKKSLMENNSYFHVPLSHFYNHPHESN